MPRQRPQSADPASLAQIDNGYKHTQKQLPKWSMRQKPDMVIGGVVPSWVNSIPGPKYSYNPDNVKTRQPVYSIQGRPKSAPCGSRMSSDSNPSPAHYSGSAVDVKKQSEIDSTKERIKSVSFAGGARWKISKFDPNPDFLDPAKAGNSMGGQFGGGKGPVYSIREKLKTEGELMSVRSPGPIYNQDLPRDSPAPIIGKRLPTEGDLMSVRSPGPANYSGSAVDVKKQSEIDSTKERIKSVSFAGGARWKISKFDPNPDFLDPAKAGNSMGGQYGGGKGPVYSIREKLKTEGELMSVRSPGPIYNQNLPRDSPAPIIGKRLPTEGDLMSVRSPGPAAYSGSAVDVKKQAEILSDKERIRSTSFGSTARWRTSPKSQPNPDFMDPAKAGNSMGGQYGGGKGPVYSIRERLKTEGELMSVRSPGPIYSQDLPRSSSAPIIGKRLPTEGDLMSVRSPGPCSYSGAAVDAKKQAEVDSTKKRIRSCSFGTSARF